VERLAIESLVLRDYHDICEASLSRSISLSVSTASTVTPGGVFSRRSLGQYEEAVEVAYSPEGHVPDFPPDWPGSYTASMKNGWSRYLGLGVMTTIH
jgi:hypothetical protein